MGIINIPFEVIASSPVGSMIYGQYEDNNRKDPILIVKEDRAIVDSLLKTSVMEIRVGLVLYEGVPLIPLMLNIDNNPELMYETWINFCTRNGESFLNILKESEFIIISFYDSSNSNIRNKKVYLNFTPFIKEIFNKANKIPSWSMKDFDDAREALYNDYSTIPSLWNALEKQ